MLQQSPMLPISPPRISSEPGSSTKTSSGFKPKAELGGGVHYEFGGGTGAFLYPTPNAGTSQASQAFWQVQDIRKEVAELKTRGVVFESYAMPGKDADDIVTPRRRHGGLVSRTRRATSWQSSRPCELCQRPATLGGVRVRVLC